MVFTPKDDEDDQDEMNEFNAPPPIVEYRVIPDYPNIKAVAREKDLLEFQTGALSIPKAAMEIETKHTKTIETENRINRERLPKAKMMLNPDVTQKREKLSEKALRDEVIDLLIREGELSFDDINKIVDQPRVGLCDTEPLARSTERTL